MARDYNYRSRRNSRRKSPPWIWALAGLAVGLFVAFLVFLKVQPVPVQEQPIALPGAMDRELQEHSTEKKPVAPPPKPRFDFYNLLPEMEVIVPEQEITGKPTQAGVKKVEQPGTYLLQAGSFRKLSQADQLRARLALLGLETNIQTVSVDDRQTWHRVRVGPFNNLRDLNEARSVLKKNGVDAILIRLKG
jgi:cell division protein FtsN